MTPAEWETGFWALMVATFVLATTHSISPDHWFPFVMVGRAKKWRLSLVLLLAGIAGISHTGTSVFIGLTGVFAKKGVAKEIAEFLENATPLLLIIFGFGYAAYAYYKHHKGSHGHSHGLPFINRLLGVNLHNDETAHHSHIQGIVYTHEHYHEIKGQTAPSHTHGDHHPHPHRLELKNKRAGLGLVAILGLTPCISLLPMTFASFKYGTLAIILVNACFAMATVGTILMFTWLGYLGLSRIKLDFFDEYGDIIAGVIIGLLGVVTKVFAL